MNMTLSMDKVNVITLTLELILWGFSLPMFGQTIYILCRRRPFPAVNCANAAIACLLFIFSTIRVVFDAKFTLEAMFRMCDRFPGMPAAAPTNMEQREKLILSITYGLQTMLGDAVVIYRCYVVWQSQRVIALPIVLWCGTIATFIGGNYAFSQLPVGQHSFFTSVALRWRAAFLYLTLLTNLASTGLLAFRIWTINRAMPRTKESVMRSTIYPIMLVLVDAGVLYSALLLTAIITLAVKSSFTFAMADIIVPTISIIFYLVIMRIAAAKASQQSTANSTPHFTQSSGLHSRSMNASQGTPSQGTVASAFGVGSVSERGGEEHYREHPAAANRSPEDRV